MANERDPNQNDEAVGGLDDEDMKGRANEGEEEVEDLDEVDEDEQEDLD